jgi:hypothetical protein
MVWLPMAMGHHPIGLSLNTARSLQRTPLVTCYRGGMVKQAHSHASDHLEDAPALSSEQEQGIEQALASLKAGKGRTLEEVRQTIRADLAKRR